MMAQTCVVHATTVALDGRAVLITGPSGSGKSSLAIQLMALGAELVADDRTIVSLEAGRLIASAPKTIVGLIEARGVGIFEVPYADPTAVAFAVDLAVIEAERLPAAHVISIMDITLPCLHNCASPHFPAAILLYLKGKRKEPT